MSERSSGGLLGAGASSLSMLKPGTPVYLLGFAMVVIIPRPSARSEPLESFFVLVGR